MFRSNESFFIDNEYTVFTFKPLGISNNSSKCAQQAYSTSQRMIGSKSNVLIQYNAEYKQFNLFPNPASG